MRCEFGFRYSQCKKGKERVIHRTGAFKFVLFSGATPICFMRPSSPWASPASADWKLVLLQSNLLWTHRLNWFTGSQSASQEYHHCQCQTSVSVHSLNNLGMVELRESICEGSDKDRGRVKPDHALKATYPYWNIIAIPCNLSFTLSCWFFSILKKGFRY